MSSESKTEIEAAVFRKILSHLDSRRDVQNIDIMNLAGFCRNCLAKWYSAEAKERGEDISVDNAKELVYGMTYKEWKDKYQNLLFWLTIFTNPLYLILSFILFLAIIYQLFANWLLFTDKYNSFRQLRTLGVTNINISTISFGISTIILSISLLLNAIENFN